MLVIHFPDRLCLLAYTTGEACKSHRCASLTRPRHGGSTVSQYLRQELHGLLESTDKSHIPEMYQYIKELGGYFKRFNGGLLSPWVKPSPDSADAGEMDLHARATLTFFEVRTFSHLSLFFRRRARLFLSQVDRNLEAEAAAKVCGSTASVAILHSLDSPSTPFFSAQKVALTVAHVGYVLI